MTRCFSLIARACCCALLLCTTLISLSAQTQEWIKGVGGPGTEYGRFVEPTSDGGFAVGGVRTSESGSQLDDFWIARFDANGDKLWERSYGHPNTAHTIFTFNSTRDGGFMIGGFTGRQGFGDESAIMYRVDSAGAIVWEYTVDYSDSDHWHLLIQRRNGGYFFGGHTDSKSDPSGDMWLQRLDDNRAIIWEKTYNRNTSEHAHAGVETDDGGAFLLGHTTVQGTEKYWVVKVDSNGTRQWDKVLGSGPAVHDSPYDVFETREGNYALVGGTSSSQTLSQGWLIIVDSVGNIVVDKHYGNPVGGSFSWSGRQTRDGGFILAGHSNVRSKGYDDMYIVKTDSAGNVEWERTYGGTDFDYGFDVVETNDGYIGVGLTASPSIVTGGQADLLLVKIRRDVALPQQVQLATPSNGTKGLVASPGPNLTWSSVPGATQYHIQVSSDAAFSTLLNDDTSLTTTSTQQSGLPNSNAKYYWHVRARNGGGWGPFSATWTFETTQISSANGDAVTGVNAVQVVPNPATRDAYISLQLSRSGAINVSLFDVRGVAVRAVTHSSMAAGAHTLSLSGDDLPVGVYQLRVTRGGAIIASTRFTLIR